MAVASVPRLSALSARADRIVALGRTVLAAATLLTAWLGGHEPPRHQALVCAILAAYTLYAIVFAAVIWRREMLDDRTLLAAHAGDLVVMAVLLHLTLGAASAPFGFLTFALIGATLCWHWRGVLWTFAACLAIVLSLALTALLVTGDARSALELALPRAIFLVVATFLLACLGLHQTRVRADLWRLAAHPPLGIATSTPSWPIREALEHAAGVLRAPRALLVWSEPEEPWVCASLWAAGVLREERGAPDRFGSGVADHLQDWSFLSANAATGDAIVHLGSDRFERWPGPVLHPDLAARYGIGAVLTVPVLEGPLEARLFLLDDPGFTADSVLVAEVAAGRIGAMLEQARLTGELREAAAAAERVRLARDLHDGVLQALAGTALQLRSLAPLVREDPERAARRLADLQEVMASQQRELRGLIRALEPSGSSPPPAEGAAAGLAERLRELVLRLERQWGLAIDWRLTPTDAGSDAIVAHDLLQIVSEAAANAARHGKAKRMTVAIEAQAESLAVAIEDDGRGFAFSGRFDDTALAALGRGPRSLRERVVTRGGRFLLDTRPGRTRFEITLPRAQEVWA
jgi:signal transduction histidine kinase